MWGLSLVAASGGHSSSWCAGLSLSRPLLLQSTGSIRAGSVVVAHGPSCSVACGIFPDQGSNPCPLHWQADSQPLRRQGSPLGWFFFNNNIFIYNDHINVHPLIGRDVYDLLSEKSRIQKSNCNMIQFCLWIDGWKENYKAWNVGWVFLFCRKKCHWDFDGDGTESINHFG